MLVRIRVWIRAWIKIYIRTRNYYRGKHQSKMIRLCGWAFETKVIIVCDSFFRKPMDRLHHGQNFEKSWNGKIHYHSIEEHPKISKIAKFGREML